MQSHPQSRCPSFTKILTRLSHWFSYWVQVPIPPVRSTNLPKKSNSMRNCSPFLLDKVKVQMPKGSSNKPRLMETGSCFRTAIFSSLGWKSLKRLYWNSKKIQMRSMRTSGCILLLCQHHTSQYLCYKTLLSWQQSHQEEWRPIWKDPMPTWVRNTLTIAQSQRSGGNFSSPSLSSMLTSKKEESSDLSDGISVTSSMTLILRPHSPCWNCSLKTMMIFHGKPFFSLLVTSITVEESPMIKIEDA